MKTVVKWSSGLAVRCRVLLGLMLVLELGLCSSGTVLDAYTRQPVPDSAVVSSANATTYTDNLGRFVLTPAPDTDAIEVSHVGYHARLISVVPDQDATIYLTPEVIDLEGVTVSAFRAPVPVGRSGPVTIIERRDATSGADTDLADALRRTVSAVGRDNVNFSSITLRGTNAEHVMVALDGIRLNSAQNGTFDLTTMPLVFADRIEVIRGGNSALYGTSPVGGMVNVVTPMPDKMSARVRGGIGSLGRRHTELHHENLLGDFGYAVGGSYSAADNGFTYDDSLQMENADFEGLDAFGKALFGNGPHRTSLFGEYASTKRGSPGSRNWPSDDARRDDARFSLIGDYAFQPNENLRTEVRAYRTNQRQDYRDPDSLFPTSDTHDLVDLGIHLDQLWYPTSWAMVMAGVEMDDHRLQSTAVGAPSRLDIAGWTQFRVESYGFNVTPQARFERQGQRPPDDTLGEPIARNVFSPKLSLGWSGPEYLNFFAGVGRSFRVPSLNDLYWPEDAWSYGNPDLEPELSTNLDFGIRGSAGEKASWWVGGYWSDLTNLIQWQPDTMFRYRPVNVAEATITGVEAEAALDFDFVGLDANLNWSQATDSSGERLYYRPDLTAHAGLWFDQTFDPVTARATFGVTQSGDRLSDPVYPDTLPKTLAGFALLDAGVAVSPKLGPVTATVQFGVRNILDTRHQTVDFYPNPGRTMYAELELRY